MGIVIPYGETIQDQDIALGTGCVIKDQSGGYHAFYTGHNDHFSPKEAVMHATSSDMLNWTKVKKRPAMLRMLQHDGSTISVSVFYTDPH